MVVVVGVEVEVEVEVVVEVEEIFFLTCPPKLKNLRRMQPIEENKKFQTIRYPS